MVVAAAATFKLNYYSNAKKGEEAEAAEEDDADYRRTVLQNQKRKEVIYLVSWRSSCIYIVAALYRGRI